MSDVDTVAGAVSSRSQKSRELLKSPVSRSLAALSSGVVAAAVHLPTAAAAAAMLAPAVRLKSNYDALSSVLMSTRLVLLKNYRYCCC
jgi:hypothetical protein